MFPSGAFGNPFGFNPPGSSRSTDNIGSSRSQNSMGTNVNSSSYNSITPKSFHGHLSPHSQSSSSHRDHREAKDPYHPTNRSQPNMIEEVRSIFGESPEMKKRARMSSDSSHTESQQTDRSDKQKPKRKRPKFIRKVTCQVCGDVANDHMHYGAIACYSCRAFFRRGVKSNAPYFCSQSQSCVINKQSRKHCQYCRFQKCMSIGMKGSWVMTEEDKIEKKEKAIIRRRWNQIKKFKKDPIGENFSGTEETNIVPQNPSKASRNMPPLQPFNPESCTPYSSYKSSVQQPDIKPIERTEFSREILRENSESLILPSAAATAREVVSAAEREYQLSQIPKLEKFQHPNKEGSQFRREADWGLPSSLSFTGQSNSMEGSFEAEPSKMVIDNSPVEVIEVKQELFDMDLSNGPNEPVTPDFPMVSTDSLKEYHSDSSESGRDFSPGADDYSTTPWKQGRQNYSTMLMQNKGKLEFSSNLMNIPVMPFTREETALITRVISTEKETTTSMPISNDTLQAIMQAVKTGTSLSYKATLEGYTVCMKRIIKFATKIDLFREFSAHDQKSLLLSNTDMLVNIRSARMLRPGYNLLDQLSVVYGKNKPLAESSKNTSVMPIKKRLEYKQVYSSPWASGEDEEQRFLSMMNTIFELQMDQTTTALIAMMALFSQV